ncbi:hypothetical protein ABEB36_011088 [Hypothenemus hampei]|uniref:Abnormal spindle-like microcephaly-associated protein n=1 Tax=Hypothenemus hampei TaxID=57062 RepID=A0ABD1EE75_HYPHA
MQDALLKKMPRQLNIEKGFGKVENKPDGKELKTTTNLHPSVVEIYRKYPNMVLPKSSTNLNLNLIVSLKREEINSEHLLEEDCNQSPTKLSIPNLYTNQSMNPVIVLPLSEKVEKRKIEVNKIGRPGRRKYMFPKTRTILPPNQMKSERIDKEKKKLNQRNTTYKCVKTAEVVENAVSPLDNINIKSQMNGSSNEESSINIPLESVVENNNRLEILESGRINSRTLSLPQHSSLPQH